LLYFAYNYYIYQKTAEQLGLGSTLYSVTEPSSQSLTPLTRYKS